MQDNDGRDPYYVLELDKLGFLWSERHPYYTVGKEYACMVFVNHIGKYQLQLRKRLVDGSFSTKTYLDLDDASDMQMVTKDYPLVTMLRKYKIFQQIES